jgi:hypothetical protein
MRFIVAGFLVLSNVYALSAEPLTPTQKYRLACNASQALSCRAGCDEALFDKCRKCVGQSCAQQCGQIHSTCRQNCMKSAGC